MDSNSVSLTNLGLLLGKAEEIRKEIEILSQTFERVLDRKDATINTLISDLEEAEAQESMAVRTHLHNIDQLINFQQAQIEKVRADSFEPTGHHHRHRRHETKVYHML